MGKRALPRTCGHACAPHHAAGGGGDGYQERGCEGSPATAGSTPTIVRAASRREPSASVDSLGPRHTFASGSGVIRSARHREDREDPHLLHYPAGYTPRRTGRHRRKVYATPKAPRRRNRYALSTIFLPRYPFGSPEDSTGAEEPGATNYRGSYLVRAGERCIFPRRKTAFRIRGILLRRTTATSCALSRNIVTISRIINGDQMQLIDSIDCGDQRTFVTLAH